MKNNNISQLPKNIKQIGNIEQNQKIYIEDYVFTYLQSYSKEGGLSDRIAILVGEVLVVDGENIVFINGAIKGKFTQQINGIYTFTKECFEYIEEQLNKYFKTSIIVGWYYSQPECSDYVNQAYETYQKELFKDNTKIFLLGDYTDNTYVFHKYNRVREKLEALEGFIIYYEKNEQMNEYMLANKLLNEKEEQERFKIKDEMLTSYTRGEKSVNKLAKKNKIKVSFLGSLSAVSVVLCFMVISSLIQSEVRITELEKRLVNLDESYKYVLSQIKNDNVQSVFAIDTEEKVKEINQEDESNKQQEEQEENNQQEQEDEKENNQQEQEDEKENSQQEQENEKENNQQEQEDEEENNQQEQEQEDEEENNQQEQEDEKENNQQEHEFKTYRIKQGDTLESISNKLYGSRLKVQEIMDLNNLENPDKIFIDMLLKLPD